MDTIIKSGLVDSKGGLPHDSMFIIFLEVTHLVHFPISEEPDESWNNKTDMKWLREKEQHEALD